MTPKPDNPKTHAKTHSGNGPKQLRNTDLQSTPTQPRIRLVYQFLV